MKSVLLVSHGSHSPKTKKEVARLINSLHRRSKIPIFEYAFLEIESPSIQQGIDICVNQGAREVVVLLNFLNSGKHVDEDIPRIIKEAQRKYPEIKFRITQPIGQHKQIGELFLEIIK